MCTKTGGNARKTGAVENFSYSSIFDLFILHIYATMTLSMLLFFAKKQRVASLESFSAYHTYSFFKAVKQGV